MSLFEDQDKRQSPVITVTLDGLEVSITEHVINTTQVFHARFPDSRKPLTITELMPGSKHRQWTSVPQGRQAEAERIGALIDDYLTKQ